MTEAHTRFTLVGRHSPDRKPLLCVLPKFQVVWLQSIGALGQRRYDLTPTGLCGSDHLCLITYIDPEPSFLHRDRDHLSSELNSPPSVSWLDVHQTASQLLPSQPPATPDSSAETTKLPRKTYAPPQGKLDFKPENHSSKSRHHLQPRRLLLTSVGNPKKRLHA